MATSLLESRSRLETEGSMLQRAIISTMAYADVFDYPLTLHEIHWYLWGIRTTQEAVADVLRAEHLRPGCLSYVASDRHDHQAGYYTLPGREAIVELRRQRTQVAVSLWRKARSYGQLIAQLPFVRMVALTGSLAVGNVERGSDIDYLIVTAPGRLWLCRACVLAIGRWASRHDDTICPNYILSENALAFENKSVYTAHEFAQMIPVYGLDIYHRMRECNLWVQGFLPNACGLPRLSTDVLGETMTDPGLHRNHRFIHQMVEMPLRTPIGEWLERWEMERKLRKLTRQQASHLESDFGPDRCKGHFSDHEHQTLRAYAARLQAIGAQGLEGWLTESGPTGLDGDTRSP